VSRRICSKDNPYTTERDKAEEGYGWAHEEAQEVPDSQETGWPSGDTVRMCCPVYLRLLIREIMILIALIYMKQSKRRMYERI